jgi:predicted metal-dependent peptidase
MRTFEYNVKIIEKSTFQTKQVAAAQLRLSRRLTFFSCLLLHVEINLVDSNIPFTVLNKSLYIDQNTLNNISIDELERILAHCVLHLALHHAQRQGARTQIMWNKACDIVVNNILVDFNMKAPKNTFVRRNYQELTCEEVYNRLLDEAAIAEKKH